MIHLGRYNRPFPSSLVPLFQNEAKCETFHMKMSSACSFIFKQIKVIFVRMVSHLDSLWNRGTRELRNGLLFCLCIHPCNQLRVHVSRIPIRRRLGTVLSFLRHRQARSKNAEWESGDEVRRKRLFFPLAFPPRSTYCSEFRPEHTESDITIPWLLDENFLQSLRVRILVHGET